ncbi:MAG: glycine cleavage system aminomethyltransferase GcvT [Candidatus Baltobacteraceae bacterium]
MSSQSLHRTPLYGEHVALGGRIVPFGGFEMPVQYTGIIKEHDAVRSRAGLFDLSHMAQFELRGSGVAAWADGLTINTVATMKPGQARYNIFTNERGGCHDDVLFYRLEEDRWLLVANAGNADKMWAYVSERRAGDVALADRRADRALIAVQGPAAASIVGALLPSDGERARVTAMKYYTCTPAQVTGAPALVGRTGYTGEDGFELFVDAADAVRVWRAAREAGSKHGLEPAGLGARDVLRLEAGMPLYGFELTEELSPLAGGQKWAVKMSKPDFVGKAALAEQLASDHYDRIAGVVLEGRVPARPGYAVHLGERRVGEVRSASFAPSVGNRNIATALVHKEAVIVGTTLGIEVRGTVHPARVVALPFYKRQS